MNKEQIFELLTFLHNVYPRLEVTQSRIDTWHALMKDQNPAMVMRKAEEHVMRNAFPPSVADLVTIQFKKSKEQIEHEEMLREAGYIK